MDIQEYLKQFIESARSLEASSELYQRAVNAIREVVEKTEPLLKKGSDGSYPLLSSALRTELDAAYRKATQSIIEFRDSFEPEDLERVDGAMQPLRAINHLLTVDLHALLALKPETSLSYREFVAQSREVTLKLEGAELKTVGGVSSTRIPLSYTDEFGKVRNGLFTEALTVGDGRTPDITSRHLRELGVDDTSTVEGRNVVFSRVADMLGISAQIARAVNMTVEINGEQKTGVFMDAIEGVDLGRVDAETVKNEYKDGIQLTNGALKQLSDLQMLDFILGNKDRHAANMIYDLRRDENGKATLYGVTGIDNDYSLGVEREFVRTPYAMMIDDVTFCSASMADKLGLMTDEMMLLTMQDQQLSPEEKDAALNRLHQVQEKLANKEILLVEDDQWLAMRQENKLAPPEDGFNLIFMTQQVLEPQTLMMSVQAKQQNRQETGALQFAKAERVEKEGYVDFAVEFAGKEPTSPPAPEQKEQPEPKPGASGESRTAFDLTNVKRSFDKLVTALRTTPPWGNTEAFQSMSAALLTLWDESERLYSQNEQGAYPPLNQTALQQLGAAYDAAVAAMRVYAATPVTGGAEEEKARDFFRRMRPLLLEDRQMLGQIDPAKGVTLPQAASNAAALVVDVGTQNTHFAGEQRLGAVPITLQASDGTTTTGYFQRLVVPDLNKNGAALFERMNAKYPAFRRLLDQLSSKPLTESFGGIKGAFVRGLKEDDSIDALRNLVKDDGGNGAKDYLHRAFRQWMLLPMLGLGERRGEVSPELEARYQEADRLIAQMERRPNYLDFAQELYNGLYELDEDFEFYEKSRKNYDFRTGEALENRSAATRQVAALLGCEELVPASRAMVLLQNGVETRGVFLEKPDGVSLDSLTMDNAFAKQFQKTDDSPAPTLSDFLTPQALKDVVDIQALMYLTGSVNVMADNLTLKLCRENDRLMVAGVSLKNNALSFGSVSKDVKTQNAAPSLFGMGVISEEMASRLKSMTREQLRAALQGFGLSEKELDVAWDRAEALKEQLALDEDIFDLNKPSEKRDAIRQAMEARVPIAARMRQIMDNEMKDANNAGQKDELQREFNELKQKNKKYLETIDNFTGFGPTDTAKGHVRVVKRGEWSAFSLKKLKKEHGDALFGELENYGRAILEVGSNRAIAVERAQRLDGLVRKAKGEPVGTILLSPENKDQLIEEKRGGAALVFDEQALVTKLDVPPTDADPTPAAVLGNGNRYSAPGADRDGETVRLFLPPDAKMSSVGGAMNQRHALSYVENGAEQKAFFTEETVVSFKRSYQALFDDAIEKNPQYAHPLTQLRDYYKSRVQDYDEDGIANSLSSLPPERVQDIPFAQMGIWEREASALQQDGLFEQLWSDLRNIQLAKAHSVYFNYLMSKMPSGGTVDKRNVAMSKVAQTLGSSVIAKCTPAQLCRGERIVDGVLMEAVDGVSRSTLKDSKLGKLTQEQRYNAMNTPQGLKSLAELQVMDYICLNCDRHQNNLFYQFEGLDTDAPKLVGVKGIDNDFSFLNKSLSEADAPTEHLTPLEDIAVIPKELAEKLQAPNAAEKIAEELASCGLSEGEIEKTKERIAQINDAIRDKKIEVVENWDGKSLDGLARLGEKKTDASGNLYAVNNIFGRARKAMVTAKDLAVEQAVQSKPLSFAAAQKVDSFGDAILRSDALGKQKQIAEKQMLEKVSTLVQQKPALSGADTYVATFRDARQRSVEMLAAIKAADPALLWSSKEFRAMRRACGKLVDLSTQLYRRADRGAVLPHDEVRRLFAGMDALEKSAKTYAEFKENQCFAANREPNARERARLAASKNVQLLTKSLRFGTLRGIDAAAVSVSGTSRLDTIIRRTQNMAAQHSGAQLASSAAELIYLKSLSRTAGAGADKAKLAGMLTEETLSARVSEIRGSAAFRNLLAAESEQSLRALMNSERGGELFERYLQCNRMPVEHGKGGPEEIQPEKVPTGKKHKPQNNKPENNHKNNKKAGL